MPIFNIIILLLTCAGPYHYRYDPVCVSLFGSFSLHHTVTCTGYKVIVVGQESRFTSQESDRVLKMCRVNVQSASIYSPRTVSGPDCFGCSSVIRDEKPPAEGCVIVNTFMSLQFVIIIFSQDPLRILPLVKEFNGSLQNVCWWEFAQMLSVFHTVNLLREETSNVKEDG